MVQMEKYKSYFKVIVQSSVLRNFYDNMFGLKVNTWL